MQSVDQSPNVSRRDYPKQDSFFVASRAEFHLHCSHRISTAHVAFQALECYMPRPKERARMSFRGHLDLVFDLSLDTGHWTLDISIYLGQQATPSLIR
jgi:hypothetical protein